MRRKLFVYAKLMKEGQQTASAKGELRLRADGDGAAHFSVKSKSVVYGQILAPERDTPKLSRYEQPQYERRTIMLTDGTLADAFEYVGRDWDKLEKVEGGRWPGKTNRS